MKTRHNVFGNRICDSRCPAFEEDPPYGVYCNARLDYQGRVKSIDIDGKLVKQYGMLCRIPDEYKLVINDRSIII